MDEFGFNLPVLGEDGQTGIGVEVGSSPEEFVVDEHEGDIEGFVAGERGVHVGEVAGDFVFFIEGAAVFLGHDFPGPGFGGTEGNPQKAVGGLGREGLRNERQQREQ